MHEQFLPGTESTDLKEQHISKMLIKTAALSVSAMLIPVAAHGAASTTLYGGGASLPAIAYVGSSFFDSLYVQYSTSSLLTSPADPGSLFGQYTALSGKPTISYCQTDGFNATGNQVIVGSRDASLSCGSISDITNTPHGFSAPTSDANFAGSDTPLTQIEYTNFVFNKGGTRVEPLQIPMIAGAIAVIYNNTDVKTQLSLTDQQICQIFSGTINNWSQLGFPSQPISIVFPSGSSDTTFGLTNHLSRVCGTLSAGPYAGDHFVTSGMVIGGDSNNAFFEFIANPSGNAVPFFLSNWIAERGDAETVNVVSNRIVAQGSPIGFSDVADVLAYASKYPQYSANLKYAKVNGKDPILNFPNTQGTSSNYALPSGTLVTDQVLGAADPATGRPTLVSISPPPAHAGCTLIAKPDLYATSTTNYPIVSISYLLGYYAGNGDDVANLKALFKAPMTYGIKSKTTTIGTNTGFAYLSGTGVSTAISKAVDACINK